MEIVKMRIRSIFFTILFAGVILFVYLASQPYTVKFSRDFYYDYESSSIFGKENLVDIPPNIVNYAYDKNFVIVKQQPVLVYIDYDYNQDYSYKAGLDESYYWLVSLAEKNVYGPLLYDEFETLCKKYEVQLSLEN